MRRCGPAPVALLHAQRLRFAEVRIDGAQASDEVTAVFSSDGTELGTAVAALEGDLWQFDVTPEQDWPAGPVTVTLRARRR